MDIKELHRRIHTPPEVLDKDDRDTVIEGTFEAPRFYVRRGSELGYHGHVYATIKDKDTGLMLTVKVEDVFLEPHRKGKVKKPISIEQIGEKERMDLVATAFYELGKIPEENRRKPSAEAVYIGSFSDAESLDR